MLHMQGSQKLSADERRIAHDDIAAWPFAFGVELERVIARVFTGVSVFSRFSLCCGSAEREAHLRSGSFQDFAAFALVTKTVIPPPFQKPICTAMCASLKP